MSTSRISESDFCTWLSHTINPWGYPAKDRSGRLDLLEVPHLGRLFAKIHRPTATPRGAHFQVTLPAADAAAPTPMTTTQEG